MCCLPMSVLLAPQQFYTSKAAIISEPSGNPPTLPWAREEAETRIVMPERDGWYPKRSWTTVAPK